MGDQELRNYFERAFQKYCENTPSVLKINKLLKDAGEEIINDHIALRTFKAKGLSALEMGEFFVSFGYEQKGEYDFFQKKLKAYHYEKKGFPKVFISELLLEAMDERTKAILEALISTIPPKTSIGQLFELEKTWSLSIDDYEYLSTQTEYGAWLAAWGFRPNHFTILVNKLNHYRSLEKLNGFLKEKGFILNGSGGEIKGSSEELLQQSSIMADRSVVEFEEGMREVPSCYYEFAERFEDKNGELYEGFIAASADKIFESTNELGK
ncbi:MAG: hypothetical protein ACJAT2_002714 [Bacteriovoracaceae bacterium]|jgi:hypothetical protein